MAHSERRRILHEDIWRMNHHVRGSVGLTAYWIAHHPGGGALRPKGHHAWRAHRLGVGSKLSVTLFIL